jgi:hypothetical protein
MIPKPRELYEDFITRCMTSGKSQNECELLFNRTISESRMLARVDSKMVDFIIIYTSLIEDELRRSYNRIADHISDGHLAGWERLAEMGNMETILNDMYINVGSFTHIAYEGFYGDDQYQDSTTIDAIMARLLAVRLLTLDFNNGTNVFANTTIDNINAIIDPTLEAPDIGNQIRKVNLRNRAIRIATTEVGIAESLGEYETMSLINMRKPVRKYWIGTIDDRIRDSHMSASFEYERVNAIPFGDYFNINGSLMLYPRDFNAPAEEVVNCRCYLGYITN